MRSARCCGLSAGVGLVLDRLAEAFVRFLLRTAGVAARFDAVPVRAVLAADFRFVDRLDSDLDAVLILLVSMRSDRRVAMPGATFWRSRGAAGQRLLNAFEKRLGVDLRRTGACTLRLVD